MTGWTPLFQQIIGSSVWSAENHVRIAWVTMLATADKSGVCPMTVGGLSALARISRAEAEDALRVLSSPDSDTLTQANEGRRIERVAGGWKLLNWEAYREKAKRAIIQEHNRDAQARFRDRQKEKENEPDPEHPEAEPEPESSEIPEQLKSSAQFMELWNDWNAHLVEKRKKPTSRAVKMQLEKLSAMGLDRAIAALKNSISGNYQGIFESNAATGTSTRPLPKYGPHNPLPGSVPNNGF